MLPFLYQNNHLLLLLSPAPATTKPGRSIFEKCHFWKEIATEDLDFLALDRNWPACGTLQVAGVEETPAMTSAKIQVRPSSSPQETAGDPDGSLQS